MSQNHPKSRNPTLKGNDFYKACVEFSGGDKDYDSLPDGFHLLDFDS